VTLSGRLDLPPRRAGLRGHLEEAFRTSLLGRILRFNGVCCLPRDRLIEVHGGGHATSESYIVATCSDLHKASGRERHRLQWCRSIGHWADGAWQLPVSLWRVASAIEASQLDHRGRHLRGPW
jgi:hypothetical protein